MRTAGWTPGLEAARDVLLRYEVPDSDIKAAVAAAIAELAREVEALPVKSDYDNEAWLDRAEVLSLFE